MLFSIPDLLLQVARSFCFSCRSRIPPGARKTWRSERLSILLFREYGSWHDARPGCTAGLSHMSRPDKVVILSQKRRG